MHLLQDWTTISGSGNGGNSQIITQSADCWAVLEDHGSITFWLEVKDVTTTAPATLSYQTSPTEDESNFVTMGTIDLAASPTPIVTKIRLGDNPAVALAKFVRWSIEVTGSSTQFSATFRILYATYDGLEGPRGIPGDTSGFRLTLTSGTPVTTSDVFGSTIYLTPYNHAHIVLWDQSSGAWNTFTSAEISFSPSMAQSTTYDVFAYYDTTSASVQLELSNAWTNNTTRADSVSRKDGVLVKVSDPTRRLVGTIRTEGNGRFIDTIKQRFVWNAKNAVDRNLVTTENTSTWTYATATWRPARNVTSNSFEYVTGDATFLDAQVHALCSGSIGGIIASVGIGVDSTTFNSALVYGKSTDSPAGAQPTHAQYRGYTVAGHHTITWLEMAQSTITFFGTNSPPGVTWEVSGMTGRILA